MRVLVAEDIGESGIALLREHFDVTVKTEWADGELAREIAGYDGILIRSASKLTADVLDGATSLKAIGRAGVGVDNVDVPAATKNGIIVANAPQSNVVTAAEHTMALLLALARNVPQAHAALVAGRWDRSKYSGVELLDKTLGVIGFGRIGQLVAERAQGFGMKVVGYDPYVGADRYREMGVTQAAGSDELYAQADFITIHLPKTPETEGWLNAEAFAKMKDGVRILNVARGPLIVDEDLQAALDSGKVAGAALDVFRSEPITDHPLFSYPNVIVTPHLGASTAEATDRAGYQAAEQVVAALQGGSVTTAVNAPSISAEDLELLSPFLPLCRQLGKLATALAPCGSVDKIEIECHGRIGERDTGPLGIAVVLGARLHGPRARRRVVRGQACERRCRYDDRQQAPPAPAGGMGAALQPPARAVPDAVSLPRRARHHRPDRDDVRRAGHQHRLGSRRPHAADRRGRPPSGDDRHDRRAGPAVARRRDEGHR